MKVIMAGERVRQKIYQDRGVGVWVLPSCVSTVWKIEIIISYITL